jgi:hypothetical protein
LIGVSSMPAQNERFEYSTRAGETPSRAGTSGGSGAALRLEDLVAASHVCGA